jgi:predicted enzyme related to lactoylglutathione lyase
LDSNAGHVTWFDLHVNDPVRAQTFYKRVFGWQFKKLENYTFPYWMISSLEGKPIGGMVERQGSPPPEGSSPNAIVVYIRAENMDVCMNAVADLGGTVALPPTPIPGDDTDAFAAFIDTEGNIVSVIAPAGTSRELNTPIVQA